MDFVDNDCNSISAVGGRREIGICVAVLISRGLRNHIAYVASVHAENAKVEISSGDVGSPPTSRTQHWIRSQRTCQQARLLEKRSDLDLSLISSAVMVGKGMRSWWTR